MLRSIQSCGFVFKVRIFQSILATIAFRSQQAVQCTLTISSKRTRICSRVMDPCSLTSATIYYYSRCQTLSRKNVQCALGSRSLQLTQKRLTLCFRIAKDLEALVLQIEKESECTAMMRCQDYRLIVGSISEHSSQAGIIWLSIFTIRTCK